MKAAKAERAVLVTGCSTGIGRSVVQLLAARGFRVVASARRAEDVAALKAEGHAAVTLDLADADSVHTALEETLGLTGGRLYALVNNGAYGQPGAVEDIETGALERQFEVNFFGWHRLTRRVIPIMRRAGGGRIVQIGSILGLVGMKYRGAYCASKFALEGLSAALRMELRGSGIHVSLVAPGPVLSGFRANTVHALKRNVDIEASVHRAVYRKLLSSLSAAPRGSFLVLPPEAVAREVLRAIESPRPRARYYVTLPAHVLAALNRLLPVRWMDFLLERAAEAEYGAGRSPEKSGGV